MSRLYLPSGTTWTPANNFQNNNNGGGTGDIIWGVNVAAAGSNGSPNGDITTRLQQYGRVPMARIFYGSILPNTIGSTERNWAPEKRWHVSFKGNEFDIANGVYDDNILGYAASVPAGSLCYMTFHHEPNAEFGVSLDLTAWKNATKRISQLLWSQTSTRDRVRPAMIFSAPKNGLAETQVKWDNSWMIPYSDMGNTYALCSWDSYGNPTGGLGYASQYTTMAFTFDNVFRLSALGGYDHDDGWAVTETSTPLRNWDTDGSARAQWFTDAMAYLSSHSTRPHHVLLWEGTAAWDQTISTAAERLPWKNKFASSI